MEKENTLRLLRRICMAFLAVYLVLALCAPVLAEEAAPAQDAAESGAAEGAGRGCGGHAGGRRARGAARLVVVLGIAAVPRGRGGDGGRAGRLFRAPPACGRILPQLSAHV